MKDSNKLRLYDEAVAWVFEHCEDAISYAYALNEIGYSREQAIEEFGFCSYSSEDVSEAIDEVYGEED